MRDLLKYLLIFILTAFMAGIVISESAEASLSSNYCFEEAEQLYGVSARLLWSISKHESNHRPTAINYNNNGTYDYCHMQINSSWRRIIGEDRWRMLSDPCYCTKIGAWVLARCVADHGYTWQAVGCYNSSKKPRQLWYANRIYNILARAQKVR